MTHQHATPAEQLTHARHRLGVWKQIVKYAENDPARTHAENKVTQWQRRIADIMDDLQTEVAE